MNKQLLKVLTCLLFLFSSFSFADQVKKLPAVTAEKIVVININQASENELLLLKGIGKKRAHAIILYRNSNGKFNDVKELLQVKGIGEKFLETNINQIRI